LFLLCRAELYKLAKMAAQVPTEALKELNGTFCTFCNLNSGLT
jgi:hypothetical protein